MRPQSAPGWVGVLMVTHPGCAATVGLVRRVVIDSCAVDPFVDIRGAYEAARQAIDAGRLEILYTPVTIEELGNVQDPRKRAELLSALKKLGRPVLTAGFIVGVSRLGQGRLSNEANANAIKAMQVGNIGNSRDALVAITALFEQCALLTQEKKLRNRASAQGIEVLTCQDLFAEIGFTPPGQ